MAPKLVRHHPPKAKNAKLKKVSVHVELLQEGVQTVKAVLGVKLQNNLAQWTAQVLRSCAPPRTTMTQALKPAATKSVSP
jgi:hypothetical protein